MADLNLNFNDIGDAIKIIDYAFEQGAFKGTNIVRQILITRDKLQAFYDVAASMVQQQQNAEEPSEDETDPPEIEGRYDFDETIITQGN